MQQATSALWRIEFRTDLTRADAPVIPLGFMLEAAWSNRARWLGMLFRRRLSVLELDRINQHTWPELLDLEPYMKSLFLETWTVSPQDGRLGSLDMALRFESRSALQFAREASDAVIGAYEAQVSFQALYGQLLGFKPRLEPALKAPVTLLKPKAKMPALPSVDVGLLNEAA